MAGLQGGGGVHGMGDICWGLVSGGLYGGGPGIGGLVSGVWYGGPGIGGSVSGVWDG